MNPKEQVQAMLEKAKLLAEQKKNNEIEEKETVLLETYTEQEEIQLPSFAMDLGMGV